MCTRLWLLCYSYYYGYYVISLTEQLVTQLEQVLLRQGSQHLLASVGASGYFRPSDQEKNHEELLSVCSITTCLLHSRCFEGLIFSSYSLNFESQHQVHVISFMRIPTGDCSRHRACFMTSAVRAWLVICHWE